MGSITYSIPVAGAVWAAGYGTGEPGDPSYGVLNSDQTTAFRPAIEVWDSYIAGSITTALRGACAEKARTIAFQMDRSLILDSVSIADDAIKKQQAADALRRELQSDISIFCSHDTSELAHMKGLRTAAANRSFGNVKFG